jgi:hypothetical protein
MSASDQDTHPKNPFPQLSLRTPYQRQVNYLPGPFQWDDAGPSSIFQGLSAGDLTDKSHDAYPAAGNPDQRQLDASC